MSQEPVTTLILNTLSQKAKYEARETAASIPSAAANSANLAKFAPADLTGLFGASPANQQFPKTQYIWVDSNALASTYGLFRHEDTNPWTSTITATPMTDAFDHNVAIGLIEEPQVRISVAGKTVTASLVLFCILSLVISALTGLHLMFPRLALLLAVPAAIFWAMFRELGKRYDNRRRMSSGHSSS